MRATPEETLPKSGSGLAAKTFFSSLSGPWKGKKGLEDLRCLMMMIHDRWGQRPPHTWVDGLEPVLNRANVMWSPHLITPSAR
jgi:hypothetical protein